MSRTSDISDRPPVEGARAFFHIAKDSIVLCTKFVNGAASVVAPILRFARCADFYDICIDIFQSIN